MPYNEAVSDYQHLVHDVTLTPFGKLVAVALSDGIIKIICVSNSSDTRDLAVLNDGNAPVSLVSWASPTFALIFASCSSNGQIKIWKESKANQWEPVYVYSGHKLAVNSLAWAPPEYGLKLACGSRDGNVSISSFMIDGGWETAVIDQAHSDGVTVVSWEAAKVGEIKSDSLKLASQGVDKSVKKWKFDDGIWILETPMKEVSMLPDRNHRHRQQLLHRLTLPSQPYHFATASPLPNTPPAVISSRIYPLYPYTPTPTPSKLRATSVALSSSSYSSKHSLSFLFILLLSLRSLYSLLPSLRNTPPSFSLFPMSFLYSLFSFLLTLCFSLLQLEKSYLKFSSARTPIFSVSSLSRSQHKLLFAKSFFLALVFLLRFQALMFCGTAAMILAEFSGSIAARSLSNIRGTRTVLHRQVIFGFAMLFSGFLLLSLSWDRMSCFPLSTSFVKNFGFMAVPQHSCLRIWPMMLAFLCGFLGSYERIHTNWSTISQLGQKRVRLITLFYVTLMLSVPALLNLTISAGSRDSVHIGSLSWPLANIVVFGVLLSDNYADEKILTSMDFQREFLVTFFCTVALELFYFPDLSLSGITFCGAMLYLAMRKLDPYSPRFSEILPESWLVPFNAVIMNPLRHILSEKKSRKIAAFLLLNTSYMFVELVAGCMSNSLGLISDACHMLFDCAALAIGLYASYISRLTANAQFNYGRGRFEVLSGYANAVFLVLVGGLILLESFERILDPQEISTNSLLSVSVGGLIVNVIGLIFFHEEHHLAHGGMGKQCHHHHHHADHHHSHHIDHNMEGIFLHVLADTMGSVGVVLSTLLIKYKGWLVADPACSLFISALIIVSVVPLLRNSAEVLLQRVPRSLEHGVRHAASDIRKMKGVSRIYSFHVWSLTNSQAVGTMRLGVSEDCDKSCLKAAVLDICHAAGVNDVTVQVNDTVSL